MTLPYTRHPDHLKLTVRLTPNAARDSLDGIDIRADGECVLKAKVTAVPEDGKANKALIILLAGTLRLPKSAISIVSGETARKKILRIAGDPEDLSERCQKLLKG